MFTQVQLLVSQRKKNTRISIFCSRFCFCQTCLRILKKNRIYYLPNPRFLKRGSLDTDYMNKKRYPQNFLFVKYRVLFRANLTRAKYCHFLCF